MLMNRAKEIIHSPMNIQVLYKNNPIWIESIDEAHQSARIKNLKNKTSMEVQINDLNETDIILEM